jgi:hypothetical protein
MHLCCFEAKMAQLKVENSAQTTFWFSPVSFHAPLWHFTLYARSGSMITKGKEPRSCLGQVFIFRLDSFTDNTKIVQHANGHFYSWKLGPGFVHGTLHGWVVSVYICVCFFKLKRLKLYSKHFIFFVTYEWANMLERKNTLSLKGLQKTNTKAYRANLKVRKKTKCYECDSSWLTCWIDTCCWNWIKIF